MKKETMIVYPFEKGGYAVRPMNWACICDKDGRLEVGCRVTALFPEKSDAEEYCRICNDPITFSVNELRSELLKREALWDAFLACIESTLKERNLPFMPESDMAVAVLERIVGDELPAERGEQK